MPPTLIKSKTRDSTTIRDRLISELQSLDGMSADDEEYAENEDAEDAPDTIVTDVSPLEEQLQACSCVIIPSLVAGMIRVREGEMKSEYTSAFGEVFSKAGPTMADLIGIFTSAILINYVGRKKSLVLTNLIFLVSVIIFITNPNVKVDFAGLVIYYVGRRFLFVSADVFVAEMAEPRYRALIIGIHFFGYDCGHSVVTVLPENSIFPLVMALLIIIPSLVLSLMASETPYWLALQGQPAEAEEIYRSLRGTNADEAEFEEMLAAAEMDADRKTLGLGPNVFNWEFFAPWILIIFMMLGVFNTCFLNDELSNVLVTEGSYGFLQKEAFYSDKNIKEMIYYTCQAVGEVMFCLLVIKVRRRLLYLLTVALHIMMLVTTYMADKAESSSFFYMNALCPLFTEVGGHTVVRMLPVEIFPAVVREFGAASQALTDQVLLFLKWLALKGGRSAWYYKFITQAFWGCLPLGILLTCVFMPETKDLPLTQTEKGTYELKEFLRATEDLGEE